MTKSSHVHWIHRAPSLSLVVPAARHFEALRTLTADLITWHLSIRVSLKRSAQMEPTYAAPLAPRDDFLVSGACDNLPYWGFVLPGSIFYKAQHLVQWQSQHSLLVVCKLVYVHYPLWTAGQKNRLSTYLVITSLEFSLLFSCPVNLSEHSKCQKPKGAWGDNSTAVAFPCELWSFTFIRYMSLRDVRRFPSYFSYYCLQHPLPFAISHIQ
jgi:hypothetical protein